MMMVLTVLDTNAIIGNRNLQQVRHRYPAEASLSAEWLTPRARPQSPHRKIFQTNAVTTAPSSRRMGTTVVRESTLAENGLNFYVAKDPRKRRVNMNFRAGDGVGKELGWAHCAACR